MTVALPPAESSTANAGIAASSYVSGSQKATTVSAEAAWFFDPSWQAGEREAQADIDAGRTTYYDTAEGFIDSL